MKEYAEVLMYAIPFFTILMGIEFIASVIMKKKVYRGMDTIASLSSGTTNVIKDVLGLIIVIVSYSWMVDKLAILTIESSIALYILAFIGIDFAGYWSHRFEHVINLFWNRHVIHHSSEEFNLACALRQSISGMFAIFFFLYIPLAIIGIPAKVIAVIAPLHLFAQFWYHTRLINKMGFLEYIIVTPSHHRVHHAINEEYIDRNYGQIFIIWDRMFGTFQAEQADIPPVYGIKKPAATWNPVIINFQHLWSLIKDAWRTDSWYDKLRIWFMPTGWRPDDVATQYKVELIEDVYKQEKYNSSNNPFLLCWSSVQLVITILLMFHMFQVMIEFNVATVFIYGGFLLVSIFAFTSLMDRGILGFIAELAKCLIGAFIIYEFSGWYNLDEYISSGTLLVVAYLTISLFITILYTFVIKEESPEPQVTIA